jgi:hypothetical protein
VLILSRISQSMIAAAWLTAHEEPRPAELRTGFWVLSLIHNAACQLHTRAGLSDGVRLHKGAYAPFPRDLLSRVKAAYLASDKNGLSTEKNKKTSSDGK